MPQGRNAGDVAPKVVNVACPSCGYNLREFYGTKHGWGWFRVWRWKNPELVWAAIVGVTVSTAVLFGAIIVGKALQ